MKRVLLLLLCLPTSVLAQTAGAILADETTINIAQCSGTLNEIRGSDDSLTVGLLWTVDVGSNTFTSGGKYQLWAANRTPGTKESGVTPCSDPAVSGTGYVANKVGDPIDAPAQTTPSKETFNLKDIATAAGYGTCAPGTSATVYLCVQWLSGGTTVSGWASGTTLALDLTSPASPPLNVKADPGDGKLHVSCDANDATSKHFKASATAGGTTRWSNQGDTCSGLIVSGLENGVTYSVTVYGMNDAFNPSPPSAAADGTPVQTEDFYGHYKQDGGQETGGCSTAAGAAGLLSALGLLLALRRRRP
jgi:hypothetical protein